jgi:hypothetical protein
MVKSSVWVLSMGKGDEMTTQFAALSTGDSEDAPGSAIYSRVVHRARFGNKVVLPTVSYDNWVGGSSSLLQGIDAGRCSPIRSVRAFPENIAP